MPRAPECLDWKLTAINDVKVPDLQGAQHRLLRSEDAVRELREATGRWFYEYGRVMKAMYGYEWERGEPAQNTDDLLAAEAAWVAAAANAGPFTPTAADLSLLADIADGYSTVLHYDRLDDLRKRMKSAVEG